MACESREGCVGALCGAEVPEADGAVGAGCCETADWRLGLALRGGGDGALERAGRVGGGPGDGVDAEGVRGEDDCVPA